MESVTPPFSLENFLGFGNTDKFDPMRGAFLYILPSYRLPQLSSSNSLSRSTGSSPLILIGHQNLFLWATRFLDRLAAWVTRHSC